MGNNPGKPGLMPHVPCGGKPSGALIGSAFLTLAGCSCFGTIWLVGVGILVSFGRGGVGCVDGAAVTAFGLLRWVLLGDTCGWMVLG